MSKHNKKFPIEKVSRTEMVKKIHATGGRFFTTTHIGVDLQPHTINCIRSKEQSHELGYIRVHARKKGPRLINPQTITELSTGGIHYMVKK